MTDYRQAITENPIAVVEFYASWCPHCQRMMPVVEELKELLDNKIPVFQYDIDENKNAASEANVESIPTFIIYRDGQPVWRHSGEMTGDMLMGKIDYYSKG